MRCCPESLGDRKCLDWDPGGACLSGTRDKGLRAKQAKTDPARQMAAALPVKSYCAVFWCYSKCDCSEFNTSKHYWRGETLRLMEIMMCSDMPNTMFYT